MNHGWIGVDLDGTLAEYDTWRGELHIGKPIPRMVERIRGWLAKGITVRIVTARVSTGAGDRAEATVEAIRDAIADWTLTHVGAPLQAVCCKDFAMIELWDDRAIQVVPNTGQTISEFHGVDEAESVKRHLGLAGGASQKERA
jgi:hypothetical protein